MQKLFNNSLIIGLSGVITFALFFLMEYFIHYLSDRALVLTFIIYLISGTTFLYKSISTIWRIWK
jgi:hypothetical protein